MKTSVATALISIASFAIGVHWGAVGVARVSALSFTFIQVPLMVYVMTRKGDLSLSELIKTLTPFCIAIALVAIPLYWMRSASTFIEMIGSMIVSYVLFVLFLVVLPGGRDFVKMLRSIGSVIRQS